MDGHVRDISNIYIQLQNRFFDEMVGYLKNTLGVRVPIVGTNWNVGASGESLSAGIYVIQMKAGDFRQNRKCLLLK
ncbi:MAG: hypothetical protein WC703_01470 [Candidatus Neomarinimicrobiota bacterium]